MKVSCALILALALFGVFANGCVYSGVGYNGINGIGTGYGAGYGVGLGGAYGGEYEGGYAARTVIAPPEDVVDNCQCVKTIVRPIVERIPYNCARRVQAPRYRPGYGIYPGGLYGRTGVIGTSTVGVGALGAGGVGVGAGYGVNGGYVA